MWSLFKSKSSECFAEKLKVDMHSHLIPGIDDGSQNIEFSILVLNKLRELGYKKIITTPHIMTDFHPNSKTNILAGLGELKKELLEQKIDIEVEAAAEYFLDKNFEDLLEKNEILHFGAKKYVLVEMSFIAPTPNYEEIFFKMLTKGFTPILAHPERYNYWLDNKGIFEYIKELGCSLQVNIPSLLGYYGHPIKKFAFNLINGGLIDFLGTDLHHERHQELLLKNKNDTNLLAILKKYNFKNIELLN